MPASERLDHVLSGGDDYELLFTAAPQEHERVLGAARQSGVAVTRIGSIEAQAGLRLTDAQGQPIKAQLSSFDHFL
jgi:thiamine-monophosphate kinase